MCQYPGVSVEVWWPYRDVTLRIVLPGTNQRLCLISFHQGVLAPFRRTRYYNFRCPLFSHSFSIDGQILVSDFLLYSIFTLLCGFWGSLQAPNRRKLLLVNFTKKYILSYVPCRYKDNPKGISYDRRFCCILAKTLQYPLNLWSFSWHLCDNELGFSEHLF